MFVKTTVGGILQKNCAENNNNNSKTTMSESFSN